MKMYMKMENGITQGSLDIREGNKSYETGKSKERKNEKKKKKEDRSKPWENK